ncbi:MAG: cytochrome c [Nitrospirales bacterium]
MTQFYRFAAVLAVLLMTVGLLLVNTSVFAADGDPAKGKEIFQAKCVTCHGPQGKGDGPLGQLLKPPAKDFTSDESKKKSPAELLDTIQNGRPGTGMVAWSNQLTEPEIQDVLSFVLTLRK